MRVSELIRAVAERGVVVGELRVGSDPEILEVSEDSRKVKAGDLFVARSGTKVNGERFVAEAIAKGAAAVVVESGQPSVVSDEIDGGGVAIVVVENANLALALLAHELAGNPTRGMKMLAVTGTKGKTTVAYLMRSILKAGGMKSGLVGTVEIDDGAAVAPAEMTTPGVVELVELFSRMRANGVEACVMEVSSHALHQHRVAGIDFDVAIFTNLTGDHLDYHGTMEAYGAAKALLFEGLKPTAMAIFNVDDSWADRMICNCQAGVVRVSLNGARAHWRAEIQKMNSEGMQLQVTGPGSFLMEDVSETLYTPLVGKHNAYNLTLTIAAARCLGIRMSMSSDALARATGAPGRLQRVESGDAAFQVFVDYAHTHDSLENVLKALRETMTTGRLICVFGCGGDRDRTKRPKMARIAQNLADRLIVTSDNPRTENPTTIIEEVCGGFEGTWRDGGQIAVEPDRRTAIRMAIAEARQRDVVLIAGKGHENYQIIGTTKHHFDDVEEALAAMRARFEEEAKRG